MFTQSPSGRLNPFLFPAETNFRFLLLIGSVLGATLFIYRSLSNAFYRSEFSQMVLRCFNDKGCWQPYEYKQAWFMACGLLLVMLVAAVIYWLKPRWIIKRRHLVALTDEDGPEMMLELERLCQQIDIRERPQFLCDPSDNTLNGMAFGHYGERYIMLTGGMMMAYYRDRALFQAVILHELAHLKNADLDKTYLSIAIWWAFLLMAVTPFVFSLVIEIARFGIGELTLLLQVAWRVAVLGALVYITYSSVLRIREFYADVRASTFDGVSEALSRALGTLAATRNSWQPFGALHPEAVQRQQVLADPSPLFRVEASAALTTGLAAGVVIHNTIFWLMLFLPAEEERTAYRLASLLFVSLIIGVVGLGLWRTAFVNATLGKSSANSERIALALGLGLAVGSPLSLHSATSTLASDGSSLAPLFSDLCWNGFLLVVLILLFCWVRLSAFYWLATVTSPATLCRRFVVGLLITALVLGWWLSGILLATEVSHTLAEESLTAIPMVGQQFFARYVFGWPLGIATQGLLVAFPLIGWWVRQSGAATWEGRWAFLDVRID